MLRTVSLSSGSGGNCILIADGRSAIVLDAGISARRVASGLKTLGLTTGDIAAILITHEHSDHISGLGSLASHTDAPLYATPHTARVIRERYSVRGVREFRAGDKFDIDGVRVSSFATPHDAPESVGYRVSAGGVNIGVATDLGYIPGDITDELKGADIVYLESNHDEQMVRSGPYPKFLKSRILGYGGHLSNIACAAAAEILVRSGVTRIILAHLSDTNNTPELAYSTVCGYLSERGIVAGADVTLGVAPRETGEIYCYD